MIRYFRAACWAQQGGVVTDFGANLWAAGIQPRYELVGALAGYSGWEVPDSLPDGDPRRI